MVLVQPHSMFNTTPVRENNVSHLAQVLDTFFFLELTSYKSSMNLRHTTVFLTVHLSWKENQSVCNTVAVTNCTRRG